MSEKELDVANARANIILALDNTSTYESWLCIDTYIEQLQQENEHSKYILTEFEKWLEEEMKRKNSRWEQFRNQINTQELVLERLNAQIVFIDCCLNKLQELKEGE